MSVTTKLISNLDKINNELLRHDKALRNRAAGVVMRNARRRLKNRIGDAPNTIEGNLLKGIKKRGGKFTTLVGFGAPAHHAFLVEYGGRLVDSRKGSETYGQDIGTRQPHPFFAPAYEESLPEVKRILSEERL